jgi:hypothetical protein
VEAILSQIIQPSVLLAISMLTGGFGSPASMNAAGMGLAAYFDFGKKFRLTVVNPCAGAEGHQEHLFRQKGLNCQ